MTDWNRLISGTFPDAAQEMDLKTPSHRRSNSVVLLDAMGREIGDTVTFTFEDLMRFYHDSRFIYPDKLIRLEPYIHDLKTTWIKLLAAGDDVARLYIRLDKNGIRNSLTAIKYYPVTWIVQHMASLRDPEGMITVLLSAITWLADKDLNDLSFGKFYWRPDNFRVNAMFRGLDKMLTPLGVETRTLVTYEYYVIKISELSARPSIPDRNISTREADPEDLHTVCELLENKLGSFSCRAESLYPASINLEELNQRFKNYGLYRTRGLIVAEENGRILGAGLAEYSSLGLSLSFYFNKYMIYLFTEPDEEKLERDVFRCLLNAGGDFYKNRGRDFIMSMWDVREQPHFKELGFQSEKEYSCLTISHVGDKTCLSHLNDFYRGRLAQRNINGKDV